MRGSHKIVTKRVSFTIKGKESEEGRKNGGWGEWKDIAAIERFSITT